METALSKVTINFEMFTVIEAWSPYIQKCFWCVHSCEGLNLLY